MTQPESAPTGTVPPQDLSTPVAQRAAAQSASTHTTPWDTFTNGFAADGPAAKWFHVQAGDYVAADGVVTPLPDGGLHVVPRGRNAVTGDPAFSISLPQESVSRGIPATNDHAKWLAYMSHTSAAGFPGFDTVAGLELVGTTRIGGQTFGTQFHPFGSAVEHAQTDLRLSAFAMATIDVESFMVFDFLFTNDRVYALYERLPFGRTEDNPYAAFSYAIPVRNRTRDEVHDASIACDRSAGAVRWILDGVEVYRVTRIGRRLESRAHLLIDLGGVEETVVLRQLDYGMGLFTLLDGAVGSGPGLVRLSDELTYYAPEQGEPHALSFVDEESRCESRLFGQGAELRIGAYTVSYAPSAVSTQPRPTVGQTS
jgi:hypothetical protein